MWSHSSHGLFFATLWAAACQAPLSMGFFRQGYWSGLPCPPLGERPNPGIEPMSLTSNLHWQAGSLLLVPPGKPHFVIVLSYRTPRLSPLCLRMFSFFLSFLSVVMYICMYICITVWCLKALVNLVTSKAKGREEVEPSVSMGGLPLGWMMAESFLFRCLTSLVGSLHTWEHLAWCQSPPCLISFHQHLCLSSSHVKLSQTIPFLWAWVKSFKSGMLL